MIAEYHSAHPERFGATSIRTYELVGTSRALAGHERAKILAALNDAKQQSDWRIWAKDLEASGLPIVYRRGDLLDPVVHQRLDQLMRSLAVGETSATTFVQGRAYVARITEERKRPPRPLKEVRDDIKRSLAPLQLRDAVKKAGERVLKDAHVVKADPANKET
jgi:hypothetical protein